MKRTITNRRSVRSFIKDKKIPEDIITAILKAGANAPSGCSRFPVRYMILEDEKNIESLSSLAGKSPMKTAPLNILVLADLNSEIRIPEWNNLWDQDCSAALENVLLEAHLQGLGGVWGGIYGRDDYVKFTQELLNLPENLIPFGVAIMGYPDYEENLTEREIKKEWLISEKEYK